MSSYVTGFHDIGMSSYVLGFENIDKTNIMVVGGKGANLGEIFKLKGIRVPDGFCISTEAFTRIIEETPSINELLDQLSLLKVEDRNKISELSAEIRRLIEGIAVPEDIHEEIARHLSGLEKKMPMQYGPAQLLRTYRRSPLRVSKIRF